MFAERKSYFLIAVASTHFPRWRWDPLAAIRIIILTVAETIINWPERMGKPGHQKKASRRGESGNLTPPLQYNITEIRTHRSKY
jgi:hypothetical protein